MSQMIFAGVFKSVNQITNDPSRLIPSRDAIKARRMILAIRTGERRTELAGVWPRANLAKWSFDSYGRFQTTPAKPALL
jgi:hypothetical protein